MSDHAPDPVGFEPIADPRGGVVDIIGPMRRILDAASVPSATLDGEGQIGGLNPEFARLCGRAPSEIVAAVDEHPPDRRIGLHLRSGDRRSAPRTALDLEHGQPV